MFTSLKMWSKNRIFFVENVLFFPLCFSLWVQMFMTFREIHPLICCSVVLDEQRFLILCVRRENVFHVPVYVTGAWHLHSSFINPICVFNWGSHTEYLLHYVHEPIKVDFYKDIVPVSHSLMSLCINIFFFRIAHMHNLHILFFFCVHYAIFLYVRSCVMSNL